MRRLVPLLERGGDNTDVLTELGHQLLKVGVSDPDPDPDWIRIQSELGQWVQRQK
jgi:hypothetical protein